MKNNKRKIFGILLIMAGFIICMIPIGLKLSVQYEQKQMLKQIRKQMEEQNKEQDTAADDTGSTQAIKANVEREFSQMELNEEEAEEDSEISAYLQYQTIIGIIEIQKLDITFPVVQGTTRDNIRVAVGHMTNTKGIGEKGNCVLAAHRGGVFGEFFKNIHKLENGDQVKVMDASGKEYLYEVYEQFVIEPTDFSVCEDIGDETTLTLLSCENNGEKRLIVRCKASWVD